MTSEQFSVIRFMKTNLKLFPRRLFWAVLLGIGSCFSRAAAAKMLLTPRPEELPRPSRGRRSQQKLARITRAADWPLFAPPRARGCAVFSNYSKARLRAKGCG